MPFLELVILLGRLIEGEGAHLFPDQRYEVGVALAHVALNRQATQRYWQTLDTVIVDGFYGINQVTSPQPWAIEIATEVLSEHTDANDPTGRSVYVLSKQDLEALGVASDDCVVLSFENGPWGLYFFCQWPIGCTEVEPPPKVYHPCGYNRRCPPDAWGRRVGVQ